MRYFTSKLDFVSDILSMVVDFHLVSTDGSHQRYSLKLLLAQSSRSRLMENIILHLEFLKKKFSSLFQV